MGFTIHTATPADTAAIVAVFASDQNEPFARVHLGTLSQEAFKARMESRFGEAIAKQDGQVYLYVRDDDSGEIVSYANWQLPAPEGKDEAKELADWAAAMPKEMNVPAMIATRKGMRKIRKSSENGQRNYFLMNLGTHPSYRRKGAATALVQWGAERADKEGVIACLNTGEHNCARKMYEKFGFEKVDQHVFELTQFGGEGEHIAIGMRRQPKPVSV
ncbi:hypothetical protein B0A48_02804 [Cryoendolithus antarcticus]|uniref:N-acetyltransferase domain-containing protein n=1 Tax=Cryoendolithus antarcticus TaxID=1507870 RepID=A0A1V8TLI7_9PEZI|nr:hypothetical protein B0A48_02804 [Cryoendolithus antarcticus]